jgi:hypothetical protein
MRFEPTPPSIVSECRVAAQAVGYPVPCPMKVPHGLSDAYVVGPTGCKITFITSAGTGKGCPRSWSGWVIGSSTTPYEHLVLSASPSVVSDAQLVNGPAWYPGAKVHQLRSVRIDGITMHAVFVPQATNDGSAFANHVVLIWTRNGHTYGIGFHNMTTIPQTLLRDEAIAASIRFTGPK